VGLEDLEKALHVVGGPFRFFLEIQFVTAGAEAGAWRVF